MAKDYQVSQLQTNEADCGLFMTYNAECLALGRSTLDEQVTGTQLRLRYLERLLQLERQSRSEQQVLTMVLGSGKKLGAKRRRIPVELALPESKKARANDWTPPSHLGSENAWLEERDHFAKILHEDETSQPERAEELLDMIEAIGCDEVMIAWEEAILQAKSQTKLQPQAIDSTAKAICRLTDRTEVRTFIDKVLIRIGKWMFAIKILQDVERLRKKGPPSKQSSDAEIAHGGNAVTRAINSFMIEVNQNQSDLDRAKDRERDYRKFKKWWGEGQIWVTLCNAVGAGVLLLIPGGQCATHGHRVTNKQ